MFNQLRRLWGRRAVASTSPADLPGESEMARLAEEFTASVNALDWSAYPAACNDDTVPILWDDFIENGDGDWELGNCLCHQQTIGLPRVL